MRKDIIIPVDFSETSLNAARYAAAMLSGRTDSHVVLYNMFDEQKKSDSAMLYLESLKKELQEKGVNNVECVAELGHDLIDCLGRLAFQKTAELIIMGITEKEEWKQLLFGSNTLKMAERNVCPVMIVPSDAVFGGIQNVVLASDFKNVEETTPVLAIKTVLEMFNAALHIVNVDSRHYVTLTEEFLTEREKMRELFNDFNPEFYFIGMSDFQDAITQFSKDKNIDLIIIIPKSHSIMNGLFTSSHTKNLAFHTPVPLLAAHQ